MNNTEIDIDEVLRTAVEENQEKYKQFGPDFARIQADVRCHARARRSKGRSSLVLRIAAAVVVFVLLANGLLLIIDIAPVRAYQTQIKRIVYNIFNDKSQIQTEDELIITTTEIHKVEKQIPFSLPIPGWLPQSFAFDNVTLSEIESEIIVIMTYQSQTDDLMMRVTNNSKISGTNPSIGEGLYEEVEVNGFPVYLSEIEKEGMHRIKCSYFNEQGLLIYITTSLDKQSLLKFIGSFKYD